MRIKIESNVKIPKKARKTETKSGRYPWDAMKVGDSFRYNGKKGNMDANVDRANEKRKHKKFLGARYYGVLRVWRVK